MSDEPFPPINLNSPLGHPVAVVDPIDWDINFRGTLRLWPEPTGILSALAALDGTRYDERVFLAHLPKGSADKTPTDTKRVREPVEALQCAGLAVKIGSPVMFRLTRLGNHIFSFFGVGGAPGFANDANRRLLAEPLIRGLSIIIEYRTVWRLMRAAGNMLTNRELNSAMRIIRTEQDVSRAAETILRYRETGDDLLLDAGVYGDRDEERKAINPKFLLAGGGGTFISVERDDPYRRILDSTVPMIDAALRRPVRSLHISTSEQTTLAISRHAAV